MNLIIIIFIIILIILFFNLQKEKYKNICNKKLSDIEYLYHMIQHHKVAIDISKIMQKKSQNPELQKILRELIWTQEIEIMLMNLMLHKLPQNISKSEIKMHKIYVSTFADFIKPNTLGISDSYCDPLFFDSKKHMEHIKHHIHHMDEKYYINHMIPHHQVAVDMSKILLKNTNNDMMIWLAYRIIRSQQEEIIILNNLQKSKNIYNSLLVN